LAGVEVRALGAALVTIIIVPARLVVREDCLAVAAQRRQTQVSTRLVVLVALAVEVVVLGTVV
jgi:hypothetical protein